MAGRAGTYTLLLVGTALLLAVGLYFGDWARQVAACRVLPRRGIYLAYCEQPLYGDYEHAAYALGTERAAVRAVQQARVLFLGNSRLQFAFSTPEVDRFFRDRGVPYHLLGFGYGESSRFVRLLLERYQPAPQVVVINADPFFRPVLSTAAEPFFVRRMAARVDAAQKWAFARLHEPLCRWTSLCRAPQPATYRDRQTGQWIWQDVLLPRDTVAAEITDTKVSPWSEDELPAWLRDAETFLALLPVPRECIILTGVPTTQVEAERMAAVLGRHLGLPSISPHLAGLRTVDNSHLSAGSAERWSAEFLRQAAPTIDRCLQMAAATGQG